MSLLEDLCRAVGHEGFHICSRCGKWSFTEELQGELQRVYSPSNSHIEHGQDIFFRAQVQATLEKFSRAGKLLGWTFLTYEGTKVLMKFT